MIDWLLCVLVRALSWLLCRLPPSVCVWIGMRLGESAAWIQPKRAQVGYLNLKAACGERFTPTQRRRIVRRIFGQLGAGLVEMLRLPAIDQAYMDRYIEIIGLPYFTEAMHSGRPVVLLTAHFGNWELSSIVAALLGHPIVALAREQRGFPKLYRLLVSYRQSKGCRVAHKGGAMRQLLRALERREPVGIVGDQSSRQGVFVEFFGRPALFATGPFHLALASGAVIVPSFIHRTRGPFHRLVIEPPFEMPTRAQADESIRAGIEWFAHRLSRHIEEDPSQWLWLHKRWKHTPERRVLVLSDGKLGHLKQSLTVLQALKEQSPRVREEVVQVRYRTRLARALALGWAWLVPWRLGSVMCLRWTLEPSCFKRLTSFYADVVISCGASTVPVNVLVAAENRAKSVVIMKPAPVPLRQFTLAFVPAHDRVPPRANVVETYGALTAVTNGQMAEAREHLRRHPRFAPATTIRPEQPGIAVFLGGDTPHYHLTSVFVEALIKHVLTVCEERDGFCLVTTSRRTPPEIERLLTERVAMHPRCALLLVASRDQLNGTIEGMLGWTRVAVVTGESVSMVSEACASGQHVVVVDPPLRRAPSGDGTKAQRAVRLLAEHGYLHSHPLPEVGHAIRQLLSHRPPVRRLDTYAAVQDAVKRLL